MSDSSSNQNITESNPPQIDHGEMDLDEINPPQQPPSLQQSIADAFRRRGE